MQNSIENVLTAKYDGAGKKKPELEESGEKSTFFAISFWNLQLWKYVNNSSASAVAQRNVFEFVWHDGMIECCFFIIILR